MSDVVRAGLLLVDGAAVFVQLFGVTGVVTAVLVLIDGAGGVVLNGSRVVPFTHLLLVGSTGRGQVLFHIGDVGGAVLELLGHTVFGHRLGTDHDQDGGGKGGESEHDGTSKCCSALAILFDRNAHTVPGLVHGALQPRAGLVDAGAVVVTVL